MARFRTFLLQLDRARRVLRHTDIAFLRDLPDILIEKLHGQPAILNDCLSPGPGEFQTICPRIFACRRDEDSSRSVRILRINLRLVLHLDVMIFCPVAVSQHAARHAGDPLPEIEIVGALIHQHTAAFPFPGRAPRSGIIVELRPVPVRDRPLKAHELSERSRLHLPAELGIQRIGSLIIHDAEHDAAPLRLPVLLLHAQYIDALRLLRQNMNSPVKCLLRDDRMKRVRRGDQNGIHRPGIQHLPVILVDHYARQMFLCPVPALLPDVTDRGKLHAFDKPLRNVFRVRRAHAADSDDSHSNLVHYATPCRAFHAVLRTASSAAYPRGNAI